MQKAVPQGKKTRAFCEANYNSSQRTMASHYSHNPKLTFGAYGQNEEKENEILQTAYALQRSMFEERQRRKMSGEIGSVSTDPNVSAYIPTVPPMSTTSSSTAALTTPTSTDAHTPRFSSPGVPDSPVTASLEFSGRSRRISGRPRKTEVHPRWHNQAYIMLLALRQHPTHEMARTDLIKAALELDVKISRERGLPKVFNGKTPMNSASAVLTNNGDNYFIPFKPEGAKSTHFKLAYEPGDFDKALEEYNKWMEQLIEHDWPLCFGVPKEEKAVEEINGNGATAVSDHNQNELENSKKRKLEQDNDTYVDIEHDSFPGLHTLSTTSNPAEGGLTSSILSRKKLKLKIKLGDTLVGTREFDFRPPSSDTGSPPPTATTTMNISEMIKLEDLDLTNIPHSIDDIVEVRTSTIPNAGMGLFAKRNLPLQTPLGFYFGVPMTEDEFDSLKDHLGMASNYSIMYRKTVLDATDDHGLPYTDPNGPIFCPFHFMNENSEPSMRNVEFINGAVVNQVIVFTTREIMEGEELFVFYGKEVDREGWVRRKDESE